MLDEYIQNGLTIANTFCDSANVGHVDLEQINTIFRETLIEVMGDKMI